MHIKCKGSYGKSWADPWLKQGPYSFLSPCKRTKILLHSFLFLTTLLHKYPNQDICSSTFPWIPLQFLAPKKMYSPSGLPTRSTPVSRPIKRHHSVRQIAHRVHDSFTSRLCKLLCAIFLTLVLVVGLISFILWLSLRPHRPRFHIHEFVVVGLGQGSDITQIQFNASARNANHNIGVHYDSMDGSVFYKDQSIGSKPLLFPFYQGPKNTTAVGDTITVTTLKENGQRWTEIMNERRMAGVVVFRLEIISIIRFQISKWHSRPHRMHANCEVSVGPDGVMLPLYKDKRCPVYFTWCMMYYVALKGVSCIFILLCYFPLCNSLCVILLVLVIGIGFATIA